MYQKIPDPYQIKPISINVLRMFFRYEFLDDFNSIVEFQICCDMTRKF